MIEIIWHYMVISNGLIWKESAAIDRINYGNITIDGYCNIASRIG